MRTTVFVKNLRVQAAHGITETEKRTKRTFQVDISIECDSKATETDAIKDTVNYAVVADIAHSVLTGVARNTVEKVAAEIGGKVLTLSNQIAAVEVTVAKVPPPLSYEVEATGVTLRFTQ